LSCSLQAMLTDSKRKANNLKTEMNVNQNKIRGKSQNVKYVLLK